MTASATDRSERRRHPRAALRLAVQCGAGPDAGKWVAHGVTDNLCPGGVRFTLPAAEIGAPLQPGTMVDLELTVPPGEGHFPFEGRIRGAAKVLRCAPVATVPRDRQAGPSTGTQMTSPAVDGSARRSPADLSIAAAFEQPIQLMF